MCEIGSGTLHHLLRKLLADTAFYEQDEWSDDPADETFHQLDPKYSPAHAGGLKTRLYFTSESHVYSLINLLRWAPSFLPGVTDVVSPEGRKARRTCCHTHVLPQSNPNPSLFVPHRRHFGITLPILRALLSNISQSPPPSPSHTRPACTGV